jgi:hypothetical protein
LTPVRQTSLTDLCKDGNPHSGHIMDRSDGMALECVHARLQRREASTHNEIHVGAQVFAS